MNARTNCLCVTLLIAVVVAAPSLGQEMTFDFEQALATIPQEVPWPSGVTFEDVNAAADMFIEKHNDLDTVSLLKSEAGEDRPGRLALLALAKLWPTNEDARTALWHLINTDIRIRRLGVVAMAHTEPHHARDLAESLVAARSSLKVRWPAVQLLGAVGDSETLTMLRKMLPDEKEPTIRKTMIEVIQQIEHRTVTIPPDKRQAWDREERLCWRAARDISGSMPRDLYSHIYRAADTFYQKDHRLSRDFLQYKLAKGELFVVAVIANQRETWAVPQLEEYAAVGRGELAYVARTALRKITSE